VQAQAQEQVIATQAAWLVDLQRQLHAAQWQQQLAQEQHRRERSSWEAAAAARARCEADAQAQAFQARITKVSGRLQSRSLRPPSWPACLDSPAMHAEILMRACGWTCV
jgi:hypothetical protein